MPAKSWKRVKIKFQHIYNQIKSHDLLNMRNYLGVNFKYNVKL